MDKLEHNGINKLHTENLYIKALAEDAMETEQLTRLANYVGTQIAALGQAPNPDKGLIDLLESYVTTLDKVIVFIDKIREAAYGKRFGEMQVLEDDKQEALQEIGYCEHQLRNVDSKLYEEVMLEKKEGKNSFNSL